MKFNKKAALELSITAIVVLIIAITVLGLGIGFIRKQFGAGTKLVEGELSNIKEQMKEQVRSGGDLLVFSLPEQVSIGKPEGVVIGVRNTEANPDRSIGKICFRVEVKCIKPFTPDKTCVDRNNIAIGGYDMEDGDFVRGTQNWFKSILGEFDLKDYDGDVFDAILQVKRPASPDTYQMEINVYKEENNYDCDREQSWEIYASKSFMLNVV